jgi:signal peptidase I/type IV secretory pathway protease TraF
MTADASTWERRLPEWQQRFNIFCENWIFAFLVAMAIRHVALEAFRIPSASMEPVLYGDPGLTKGDFVVVDKLWCRFTGVRRWDVTVFQFPQAEIEAPGNDARPALDANGDRLDVPLLKPLMCRNFVKRAVILPGDTFFIRGGNIYLKQPDGSWQASRKPANLQERVWQEIYRHDGQAGYVPWEGAGGSAAKADGTTVAMTLTDGGAVAFTQPFRNLYLKEGVFRVHPAGWGSETDELPTLSMTAPLFTYKHTGQTGNAWDLDHWEVSRMNSADLDNMSYGTLLNRTMTEWVQDARLVATVAKLDGHAELTWSMGARHWQAALTPTGWRVLVDGTEAGSGTATVVGAELAFAHLDDQVILSLGGVEVFRRDVASVMDDARLGLRVTGAGALSLAGVRVERDQHYTTRGFLTDATQIRRDLDSFLAQQRTRIGTDPIVIDKQAQAQRLVADVRAQMLGKQVDDLSSRESVAPVGTGPDNAITAPPGAYLLMGDNSPQSWDGREWGWVPAENIRGRVLVVAFPPSRWRVVR